jgi:anthranilate synthase/aminodeoxychorismate synthase-like glutamine amidotransferase
MRVLLIDNYDSFTHNLYQLLGELCQSVEVVRNNSIPFEDIDKGSFSHVVISPGPGDPTDEQYFGGNDRLIKDYYERYPILGVCLGHQGIGAAFGGSIVKAPQIMHGKTSTFNHSGRGLFRGLPSSITAMRYHSLVIDPSTFPKELIVDAVTEEGSIMAFHHEYYPTFGLQFHPESFRTLAGKMLLTNFLIK